MPVFGDNSSCVDFMGFGAQVTGRWPSFLRRINCGEALGKFYLGMPISSHLAVHRHAYVAKIKHSLARSVATLHHHT